MRRQTALLTGVLVALLCGTLVWSVGYLSEQRKAANDAHRDLAEIEAMAGQIEAFRKLPAMAAEHERVSDDVTGLIERIATHAGVPPGCLVRITPEPPARLGDTVYKEKPTQVFLKNVTPEQIVRFAHGLVCSGQRLHARSIRLSSPGRDSSGDLWHAELVFTYLIYDPPKKSR